MSRGMDVVPSFLWQDLSVRQFYRPERLNWYVIVSGIYRGTRWDQVVGPFEDEQPQNVLEHIRDGFLTSTFPEPEKLGRAYV